MLVDVVVFTSLEVFHFIAFRRHPSHPSVSYRRVFTPILYFQPSSLQSDSRHFHFNFSGLFIFTTSVMVLSRFFYHRSFLPYIPSLVTQMRAGTPHPGSSTVPALTELSLPADAWSWTTDVSIIRPLVYQLRQRTTMKLKLNYWICFTCSKYMKDYKNTLNKTWCTA